MITLSAEPLAHIGSVPITNALINTLFVDAVLIGFAIYMSKNIKIVPTKLQSTVEMVMEGFHNLTQQVAGKHTAMIFPWVMSFFLFILVANWSGLLPIISSIGVWHHGEHGKELIPLMRATSTDLNTTLALALISLVATHTMSITTLGFKSYITRFFPLNLMGLYQGILELVSEITKIVSFSFRLFGNIFVGEVMLASLTSAFAFLLPIPVVMYEFFVGAIQATIFALLTMAFMALFTTPHGSDAH